MNTDITPQELERENLAAAVYGLDLPRRNQDEIFAAMLPVLVEEVAPH